MTGTALQPAMIDLVHLFGPSSVSIFHAHPSL